MKIRYTEQVKKGLMAGSGYRRDAEEFANFCIQHESKKDYGYDWNQQKDFFEDKDNILPDNRFVNRIYLNRERAVEIHETHNEWERDLCF